MKRTPLKRKSKSSGRKLEDAIWDECKRIIRERYGNDCYTCGAKDLSGSNRHTGHMIAKAALGAFLKYDLRLLRPQCYRCNINLGGMGAEFLTRMRAIEGDEYVDSILKDRQVTVKSTDHYTTLLEQYKNL